MKTSTALTAMVLAMGSVACGSAEVAGGAGSTQQGLHAPIKGLNLSYYGAVEGCLPEGGVLCSIGPSEPDTPVPPAWISRLDNSTVVISYAQQPDFLLERGGLSVDDPMVLHEEITAELGLSAGTVLVPQFGELTPNEDGELVNITLGISQPIEFDGTETFGEPTDILKCCDDGVIKICYGCVGGNSSNNYLGSACCFNSIHFDPDRVAKAAD